MIKHSLPAIFPSVTSVMSLSQVITVPFQCNGIPITAEVIPVLKEGDHEKPNNHRPISLLPVLSKVCERISLDQLMP